MSRRNILMVLIVLMPVLALYAAVSYGYALPFWDQWVVIPFFIKAVKGQLTLAEMWAHHYEHRIFFPKAVLGGLAYLSNWNILYELVANVVVAGFIFGALALTVRQTMERSDRLPLAAAASLLIFSPIQAENWSCGFQLQIFLSVLGVVLAVLSVTVWPGRWKGLAGALGGAILASYSFNSGLVSLVAVGGLLLVRRPLRLSFIVTWVAATVVIVCLYYQGYTREAYEARELLGIMSRPFSFIGYVLAYLGLPLGFQNLVASIVIGGLLSALLGWCTIGVLRAGREEFEKALPWLTIAAYAFASAVATGVGRMLFFGVRQALSTRYATTSILFSMAVLVVVAQGARLRKKAARGLPDRGMIGFRVLGVAFGLAYVLSFASGWKVLSSQKRELTGSPLIAYTPILPPRDYEIFKRRAALLTSERVSIFAFEEKECSAARRRVTGGMGRIDLINGEPLREEVEPVLIDRDKDSEMVVVGWAADVENRKPADRVLVIVDGEPVARAFYGLRRPDVSRVLESEALLFTGWEAFIDLGRIGTGVHRLSLQIFSGDGSVCYRPERTYLVEARGK